MGYRVYRQLPGTAAVALSTFVSLLLTSEASAHVKWFCAYNIAGSPEGLENVLCPDFELLVALALLLLAAGCLLEESPLAPPLLRALDRVTAFVRADTDRLVRVVCSFFFVSLWTMGGILLTPELTTTSPWISWLQLAMAVGLIWRQTAPLSALGIVFLFATAVSQYGVFHLADYPIFLGIALYLALTGLRRDLFGIRSLDILRWAAAITLMWASIEKWAYPQWSYPLFIEHPTLAMGYDSDFFMRAAGVIEFTLAFALIWTPLVRRWAAVVLAGMFISACFAFGKIDVIGHSPIVVVLFAIIADDAKAEVKLRHLAFAPAAYAVALAVFLTAYYGMHTLLYPPLQHL
jgi:hypothetical protein